jgi:hypothetical protein
MHPMIPPGDEDQLEACLLCFKIVLILTQARCAVCAKRTIGSEIVLNAPDGTPRLVGHVESRFGPFGDSVLSVQYRCTVCTEHTIGSGIVWDAPDDTPR